MTRTSLESRVYTVLHSYAPLVALVGTRIYALQVRQADTLPAICYARVTTSRPSALVGELGLEEVRLQVTCVAATYVAAKAVVAAVLDAMDAATAFAATPAGQADLPNDESPDEYRVVLEFDVWNKEV